MHKSNKALFLPFALFLFFYFKKMSFFLFLKWFTRVILWSQIFSQHKYKLKIFIHLNANYGVTPFQYHISITIGDYCKWSFIHGIFVDIALQPGRTLCAFKLSGNTVTVSLFFVPSLVSFSLGNLLKVSKSREQNTKFNHTPKKQWNFVHFFAPASKKWLKQKIKALDVLN